MMTEKVALPPVKGKFSMRGWLPSKAETVPVAVDGETVTVKVTDWPTTEGLGVEVNSCQGRVKLDHRGGEKVDHSVVS